MILAAQVDEADVGKLRLGQDCNSSVQAFRDEQFRGKVHTDIKQGFIKAETISYNDLHEFSDKKRSRSQEK